MASIACKTGELDRFARDVGASRRLVRPQMRLGMMQSTALVQKNVKEAIRSPGGGFGSMVLGAANNLFSSWTPQVSESGERGSVSSSKIYSEVMNTGRRPGAPMPPVDAIERWVKARRIGQGGVRAARAVSGLIRGGKRFQMMKRSPAQDPQSALNRKLGALKRKLKGHTLDRSRGPKRIPKPRRRLTDQERQARYIRGIAFVIARSIAEKGIKGRFYVPTALRRSQGPLLQIWSGIAGGILQPIVRAA